RGCGLFGLWVLSASTARARLRADARELLVQRFLELGPARRRRGRRLVLAVRDEIVKRRELRQERLAAAATSAAASRAATAAAPTACRGSNQLALERGESGHLLGLARSGRGTRLRQSRAPFADCFRGPLSLRDSILDLGQQVVLLLQILGGDVNARQP